MWIVSGPFDGEVVGDVSFQKSKLLKSGSKYSIGRKDDCKLFVNHKKVSKSNGEFIVGNCTQKDVLDPSAVPQLELCNTKDKPMLISRNGEGLPINPSATRELRDGDAITIAGGVGVTVSWLRISCFSPNVEGSPPISLDACASLGISVTPLSNPANTHHLISNYAVDTSIAKSLISATQFARPEWLHELIRLGTLSSEVDGDDVSLEKTFVLPPLSKFRPGLSSSISHEFKSLSIWEPNEGRMGFFRGFKFVFVGEKGREVQRDMRDLVERGQGEWEAFPANGGKAKWHQHLSKNIKKLSEMDSGKGLVIVGDQKALKTSVGTSAWAELVEECKSFGLRFISSEKVLQAVLHTDVTYLDCKSTTAEGDDEESLRPSFVPDTSSDGPSISPAESKTEESSSGARPSLPSRPPPTLPQDPLSIDIPPPPRRPLSRRTKGTTPVIVGIDDDSTSLDVAPRISAKEAMLPPSRPAKASLFDLSAPIPMRSSRLKRRVAAPSTSESVSVLEDVEEKEPPLKKFKALFDSSDPDKLSQDTGLSVYEGLYGSITQSSTATQSGTIVGHELHAVQEEEEESQAAGPATLKRKAVQDEDFNANLGAPSRPAAKKKTVDGDSGVGASQSAASLGKTSTGLKPMSQSISQAPKSGAVAGQPDTDVAFLKALSSRKRSKKAEDNTDREFNELKISKPDIQQEAREDEWHLLAEFGVDHNIRGNFMVIVEIDFSRGKDRDRTSARPHVPNPGWDSRPNFKKFKKVTLQKRTQKIELLATQENDYGVGTAYWKGNKLQSQSQSQSQHALFQKRSHKPSKTEDRASRKEIGRAADEDFSEDEIAMQVAPREDERAASSGPPLESRRQESPELEKVQPLFLDDDDDAVEKRQDPNINAVKKPPSKASGRKPKKPSRRVVVRQDSEDEGATFKGFRGRK